jgi:hypothetical protein
MYVILRRNYISIVNMDISSLMAIFEKKAIADN